MVFYFGMMSVLPRAPAQPPPPPAAHDAGVVQ